MKYKCKGYQLVEQEDGTEVKVPCPEEGEEENLFIMKRVYYYGNEEPGVGRVANHALCKGCTDRINEHRVEVLGQEPIVFETFLSAMEPARARAKKKKRANKLPRKPKSRRSSKKRKKKSGAHQATLLTGECTKCSYCGEQYDIGALLCEELSFLRQRLCGAEPTREQCLLVGVCTSCHKEVGKDLGKMVSLTSIMRQLGYLSKQPKEESKAS